MTIRKATQADIAGILALDPEVAQDESRSRHIHEWVSKGFAYVALVDQRLTGYAVLEYSFFYLGFISMVMVSEAGRRQGVGAALISHVESICKTRKLFTSTNESNEPMKALLHRLAFEPSGVVYNLDDDDPELFYFKLLHENRQS